MTESKLAYRLRVVRDASFKKFFDVVGEAHRLSGNSKLFCLYDILRCMKTFDAGYYDYVIFQFYDLTDEQKNTYLTRFRSKRLNMQYNDQEYIHIFEDKNEFNEVFRNYLGREFLDINTADKDEIISFFDKHDKLIAKHADLSCGIGIELLKKTDFESGEAFYAYIKEKKFDTLEDDLENHPDLARIYSGSLNTMRMITLVGDDGKPYLLYAVQKFGINGRVVDNYGVHGPVDLETGEFLYPAHSGDTKVEGLFTTHPNSGEKLVGFKTPLFSEAKEMALQAALVVPQIRYVGWDVAVTPNGPAIIEGNSYTAHDFWQLPGQTPGGIGIMPVLKKVVPSFKY